MPIAESSTSEAVRHNGVQTTTPVLVVDDDPLISQLVQAALPASEFSVQVASSGAQALANWDRRRPSVLLLDHILPDSDGLSLLAQFRQRDATLPVIFITAHGSSQTAIDAMKQGAFDYLSKPLDLAELESRVRLAREARRLMRVPVVIQAAGEDDAGSSGDPLIGNSPGMEELFKGIGRAAARDMSVLLVGERGTGKALVARAIYQNSARSSTPFRTIACSDYESHELEVELFGIEGANSVVGRIEQCAGGTLLLEEIGIISPHLQSRLMHLLTTGQYEPLAGGTPRKADVRILATSSQDLEQRVNAGSFRADFYYYLRSLSLHLPPLRERPGDIPLLVDHFVKRFSHLSRNFNSGSVRVAPEALHMLANYSWPGNLDQLQSVLQQALIENTGTVLPSNSLQQMLQSTQRDSPATSDRTTHWRTFVSGRLQASTSSLYAEALGEMERHLLALVMENTDNNQAKSARLLGITRGNLRKKLRSIGLVPPATTEETADPADEANDDWHAA